MQEKLTKRLEFLHAWVDFSDQETYEGDLKKPLLNKAVD